MTTKDDIMRLYGHEIMHLDFCDGCMSHYTRRLPDGYILRCTVYHDEGPTQGMLCDLDPCWIFVDRVRVDRIAQWMQGGSDGDKN